MPYFIICIPDCINIEGQFEGGRKEGREGNSGDWSSSVEGSSFADQSWETRLHTLKTYSRGPQLSTLASFSYRMGCYVTRKQVLPN